MYHFDFKVWQSYFEVKMVHVRTQLEQLAPGQKCPGAQLMQFRWHTMSFIWQMAKWQKAKARPEAFASLACGLGLGVRKLHFAGEKLAEETEKLLRAERYRMVDPFETKICDMYV